MCITNVMAYKSPAPQTPSERTAWLRERAALRGMPVADCARYIAKLREDHRAIAGQGSRIASALGLGTVRPDAGADATTYKVDVDQGTV